MATDIQMYGQVRKHGITEPVGSSGSLYLFIRFSFPVLIAIAFVMRSDDLITYSPTRQRNGFRSIF